MQSVEKYYDSAANLSEVQPHTLAHLRAVDSVLRVTFPIECENGKYEVIEGKGLWEKDREKINPNMEVMN